MKIGMNLLLWTDHVGEAHDGVLDTIKELGYDAVEVPIFNTTDLKDYARLGKRLQSLGLSATAVTVMGPETNPISPDAKVRAAAVAYLDRVLECGQQFGCEILCGPLHSAIGVFSGTGPTETEFQHGVETLQEAAQKAEARGIKLAVEYLNRFENYFLTTAAQTSRFVKAVNHPSCKMMYDSFHAHIEEKDQAKAIASCADRDDPRPRLRERPRHAGHRPGALGVVLRRPQADRLRRLPDDRGVRHGPAGARRRNPRLARPVPRRHGTLPRGAGLHQEEHPVSRGLTDGARRPPGVRAPSFGPCRKERPACPWPPTRTSRSPP